MNTLLLFWSLCVFSQDYNFFAFSALGPPFLDVSGFDVNCRVELFRTDLPTKEYDFVSKGVNYKLSFDTERAEINILKKQQKIIAISLSNAIQKMESYLVRNPETPIHRLPQNVMRIDLQQKGVAARVYIYNISGRSDKNGILIYHLKSDVVLRFPSRFDHSTNRNKTIAPG